MVTTSLDAMAAGGIYDHLGGGFARYSTDERWLVPHFEKMLYDQALLARAYLHAWQVTGDARYRQVLDETIGYVLARPAPPRRWLLLGRGRRLPRRPGPHREGLFQTWTVDEVRDVLGCRRGAALDWWGITDAGQLRGPQHPAPARRGAPGPSRRSRAGPRRPVRARGHSGSDPVSTTRC